MATSTRRVVFAGVSLVMVVALVAILALIQPWRLFTNTVVNEGPDAAGQPAATTPVTGPGPGAPGGGAGSTTVTTAPDAPGPKVLSQGMFVSHEHTTKGAAQVVQRPDGTKYLRLENLDTSDGPDLVVWLSAGPVVEGRGGWFVFKDHDRRDLGALKGNKGSQNYEIPADVDLGKYRSVTVWCKRFSVSFGAAPLQAR